MWWLLWGTEREGAGDGGQSGGLNRLLSRPAVSCEESSMSSGAYSRKSFADS